VEIGFWLSSEEHGPTEMVRAAQQAEAAGFPYVQLSDHFHPWIDRQGQSPFVWSVIAGIAATTKQLAVGTGVTCPIGRIHPAIIAQAAATSNVMLDGRFFLGVGTGENLNEHVTGAKWPPIETRQEMLEEAVDLMRLLWRGDERSFHGRFFDVEDARLYTLGDATPVYVAASGPSSADLAARIGDGLTSTSPDPELVSKYDGAGGAGKPKYIEMQVCWARTAASGRKLAHELWPIKGLGGQLAQELRRPADFETVAEPITAERSTKGVPVGPDVEPYVKAVKERVDAGFDHIGIHQIGPDQDGFLAFWEKELRPALERRKVLAPA
jgi:coenzyme F420-dependent glucose-6-phosphate dehydrogenase